MHIHVLDTLSVSCYNRASVSCACQHQSNPNPMEDHKCRQPGHFACDCTASPEAPVDDPPSSSVDVPASNPSDVSPPSVLPLMSVNAAPSLSPSDDESEMDADEFVLASAGDVSLSPRRSASKRPADTSDSCDTDDDSTPTVSRKKPAFLSDDSPSPPSIPPSGVPAKDSSVAASSHAHTFQDGDVTCSIDLHRLARRCVIEDSATPEMYRECFYNDPAMKSCLPVMSVFPDDSGPLPDVQYLSPDVLPAKFPGNKDSETPVLANPATTSGSSPPVPALSPSVPVSRMDVHPVHNHCLPKPMTAAPPDYRTHLLNTGHSSHTYLAFEIFDVPSSEPLAELCVFDYGIFTESVVTKNVSIERSRLAHSDVPKSVCRIAVDLPCLPDTAPAQFPNKNKP